MAVVINEFEVMPEAPPQARSTAPDPAGAAAPPDKLEPCTVAAALRVLDVRALRIWAH